MLWFLLHMYREAELEEDSEYFIGPPPPAVVAETESANEAERFEEVWLSYLADTLTKLIRRLYIALG